MDQRGRLKRMIRALPLHKDGCKSMKLIVYDRKKVFGCGFVAGSQRSQETHHVFVRIVELEAELFEFSSPAFMPPPGVPPKFYNHQKSVMTLNEAFGIGGMGGDDTNVLAGSPVGMLLPGKGYRYRTLVTINALASTNGIASAFGTQSIDFTAVPEPSSAGLILFVGVTLRQILRRKRRGISVNSLGC